jgi:hypothetical protein
MSCPCPHRILPAGRGKAAQCGLVRTFVEGLTDEAINLPDGTCEACLHYGRSEPWTLNPITASVLLNTTARLLAGPEDPPDPERARELQKLALRNLEFESGSDLDHRTRVPRYTGPCYFSNRDWTPEADRDCAADAGGARSGALFPCRHPSHPDLVGTSRCVTCGDYDPGLAVGNVEQWMVGVITAPRREATLERTVQSLVAAGWTDYHLFAEPGSEVPSSLRPQTCTVRVQRLGAWPNWVLGLAELFLRDPTADAYFMVQDDALFCRGTRAYLEWRLWPSPGLGVVSLYTPSHHRSGGEAGFFRREVGWGAWGALAYVFPNPAVRSFLGDPRVIAHRSRGPRGGVVNVDSVVGRWCEESAQGYWMHNPSLAQHIGQTTTLRGRDTLEGRRSAADFPGAEVDIRLVMREL